jgi:hypothetical protein
LILVFFDQVDLDRGERVGVLDIEDQRAERVAAIDSNVHFENGSRRKSEIARRGGSKS